MILWVSFLSILLAAIALIAFAKINEYKRVERFYYNHNQALYLLLTLSYYVLYISLVINGRFLVIELFKLVFTKKSP